MRRADREITNQEEILEILRECKVCRIALIDGDTPYIVPLNFGIGLNGDKLCLWLHCAKEGRKLDIIRENPSVAFECDILGELICADTACRFSMKYASVMGEGRIKICADDDEKRMGLSAIMEHYAPEREYDFPQSALNNVCVLKLDVESISGKTNER